MDALEEIAMHRGHEPDTGEKTRWRVDRTVPLALIFALVVQAAGLVWYFSATLAELGDHERRIAHLEIGAHEVAVEVGALQNSIGRIDERTGMILDHIVRRQAPER